MKILNSDIKNIRSDFYKMKSASDLLDLLNISNNILFDKKARVISLSHLAYFVNPQRSSKFYKEFNIVKKSGKLRVIHAPETQLKILQKNLAFILQCVFEPHKAAYGFVWNKSIVDNAKQHLNKNYVFNIDLKDFFPSIEQGRIWKCLQLPPFSLETYPPKKTINVYPFKGSFVTSEKEVIEFTIPIERDIVLFDETNQDFIKYRNRFYDVNRQFKKAEDILSQQKKIQSFEHDYLQKVFELLPELFEPTPLDKISLPNIIASLCSYRIEVERYNEDKNLFELVRKSITPQGAPTSPIISNIVCQRLDYLLTGVANRFGLTYSRYADDITFSSKHNVYDRKGDFYQEVLRIIKQQKFAINEDKTRLQKNGYRKEVTGLLVNDTVNVQKRYIKDIRKWLYYWEEYGIEKANNFFATDIRNRKNDVNTSADLKHTLQGKLSYLGMVKGKNNSTYQKLNERFKKLTLDSRENHLNKVLNVLFTEGINSAMLIYNPIQSL
ncbi:MAG: hypothetical protein CFE25_05685 [Chitinophagaceae bacterium BSSC1]|nr:MAG: hypothetical protein CFE25_05685 [Chitinophagaceae bacterium BSSC1]